MSFLLSGFCFFLSLTSVFAEDAPVTFQGVESELFPTWRPEADSPAAEFLKQELTEDEKIRYDEKLSQYKDTLKSVSQLSAQITDLQSDIEQARSKATMMIAEYKLRGCFSTANMSCVSLKQEITTQQNIAKNKEREKSSLVEKLAKDEQKVSVLQTELGKMLDAASVEGVLGRSGDHKTFLEYLPLIITILLKFVAPVAFVLLVYSGLRFIIAGNNDKSLSSTKEFFQYAFIGFLVVMLSFSLVKVIYFFLSG